jgi:hypothetical protein
MRTATSRVMTVTLDMTDAMELSEILDYVAQWLTTTSEPAVHADLARFALDPAAPRDLSRILIGFSRLLVFGEDDTDDEEQEPQPW